MVDLSLQLDEAVEHGQTEEEDAQHRAEQISRGGLIQELLDRYTRWLSVKDVSGTDLVAGREAIVVECSHPRTVERVADRPDFHIQVAVDRAEGIITRLVETIGGEVTRAAIVTSLEPDAQLAPATFEFEFPDGTTMLF